MRILAILLAAAATPALADTMLIRPARVFDGTAMHQGWSVVVEGNRIAAAGPGLATPAGARTIDLPNATLMPGMIDDQVCQYVGADYWLRDAMAGVRLCQNLLAKT